VTSGRTAPDGQRLGIYIDTVHRVFESPEGPRIATDPADFAFVGIFLPTVGSRVGSLLLFGRTHPGDLGEYVPLPPEVELVELPHYGDLRQLPSVARAFVGTAKSFWMGLERVDTVWIFGPHPFGLMFALMAALRRKEIVLGVRQDTMAYFRSRLPSRRWAPLLLGAHVLDASYRLLSRRVKTIVTGPAIARRYGSSRPEVFVMWESVVRSEDVALGPRDQPWDGQIELVTVGRLDPEKNPLLLVEAVAVLNGEDGGRYSLTWVGGGPMEQAIRERAEQLGVADRIDLVGFVPFGPELLDLYRRAHAFVHVSMTEGVPKVLVEALGCATPIVATDVGGVSDLLDGGRAGLLVPPADLDALVTAITRISADSELRERLVVSGLEVARQLTLETQSQRVAGFISSEIAGRGH
jgi:glycosyltransferase involved in cell wall biosynthesis